MRKLNIGKIKIIFFLLLLLPGVFDLAVHAEDKEDQKKKIMEIKLNEDFVFGEGVSDNKDIAYGLAMDDLLIFANELKSRNSQEILTASDLVTKVETLVYENGSRVEVIVYLPVDLVLDTSHKQPDTKGGVVLTQREKTDTRKEPIAEEPKAEEPKIEEPIEELPVAEEPKIEEPIEELPVAEEPKIEEIEELLVAEEPKVEEPIEELPVAEEPKVEEPIVEEKIAEEPKQEIVPTSTLQEVTPVEPEIKPVPVNETSPGIVEEFLMTQDNFTEIKKFLSEMKQKGRIVETGVTSSTNEIPTDASLILMDEYGGILALLSPQDINGRINYKTRKTDTENNYNSKFILWYKK